MQERLFDSQKYEHLLLALMLVLLHIAMWSDFGSQLSHSMMLAHMGLFLLWQPIWRRDQKLDQRSAAAFTLFTLAFVYWMNWLLMFIWLLLLIGLIGGRAFTGRREQYAYRITLVFLILELLIGCNVPMFSIPIHTQLGGVFEYALLVPLVLLALIPTTSDNRNDPRNVDFLNGLTVAMLIAILAMGSLLVMYTQGTEYLPALLQTLFAIGLFLLLIIWLLSPHLGFSGLNQIWTQYVLNVGTPFEDWLKGVSLSAEIHEQPRQFLDDAMQQFSRLDWVSGVRWCGQDDRCTAGSETDYPTVIHTHDLEVTVYTDSAPGATLLLHSKLLIQLIGFFHWAKTAQLELAKQTHLKAVYETGARITHDIKNLLQSLHALTMVLQEQSQQDIEQVNALLRKQLPTLTQRLQLALDKLQSPELMGEIQQGSAEGWWLSLVKRHEAPYISFLGEIDTDRSIPLECFDNVAENLLENTRLKRQLEPQLQVVVKLSIDDGRVVLSVQDDGAPMAGALVESVFRMPLQSDNGLGIGLYQAYNLARKVGYKLVLAHNRPGQVCFELSKR